MFCPKCGKQVPDGAIFCDGCGNKLPVMDKAAGEPEREQAAAPRDAGGGGEKKSRKGAVIGFVAAAAVILAAVCLGVYYFTGERETEGAEQPESGVEENLQESGEAALSEETDAVGTADDEMAGGETAEEGNAMASEQENPAAEEEPEVVSDTNEVVAKTILYSIPKSAYSYRFNDDLGNARVVVREQGESMPETADIEPEYVPGMEGRAVYLNGTYGIQLSDVGKVGDSYTVAFWMKADELYDWVPFIHIGYDLLDQNNRCRLWLGQKTDGTPVAPIISSERQATSDSVEIRPGRSVPNTIEAGSWYHIAFTVDGSRQGSRSGRVLGTLYVEGQYICEGDVVLDTMNVDDFQVYLGINCWDTLYPVAFDDVKIWDQVLDSGQIKDLYNAYMYE